MRLDSFRFLVSEEKEQRENKTNNFKKIDCVFFPPNSTNFDETVEKR